MIGLINLWTDNKVYANLYGGGVAFGGCNLSGTDWNHLSLCI